MNIIFIDKNNQKIIIKAELNNGNFSISGEVQEKNDYGIWKFYASGQIYDQIIPKNKYQKALISFWERWHLNDMHAECKHQGKLWNTNEKITVTEYIRNQVLRERVEKVKELIMSTLIKHGTIKKIGNMTRELLSLKSSYNDESIKTISPYFQRQYKIYKEKQEYAGHIKQTEHEKGLLCKPCPICSYEYGTKWLKEELPPKFKTGLNYIVSKINEEEKKYE